MFKKHLFLTGLLFMVISFTQVVISESISENEEMYVTTEDIILDIVFPTIDKRVIQEYGGDNLFGWELKRIASITYNDNHSYDVTISIEIPPENFNDEVKEDLVKVRISPSCESEKLNKQKCNHEFKIEILDYKHLS